MAGVVWGIGHTATLFIFGMSLILLKAELPDKWVLTLEFGVGVMLVWLGVQSIISLRTKKLHVHPHQHGDGHEHHHVHSHQHSMTHEHKHREVSHLKSLIIGVVHGLAGSAAMVLLTMSTMTRVWQGALYILVFGLGTVIGMLMTTTLIGLPFVLTVDKLSLNRTLIRATGALSAVYGIYYMYNLGVNEGLFALWMH